MKQYKLVFGRESRLVRRDMHEVYKHPRERVIQNATIPKPKFIERNGEMVPYTGP